VTDQDAYKRQMAFFDAQTLRSLFIEQRVGAAVTDEAVRAAYDRQIASIPSVPERRLRHILVASEAEAREIIAALSSEQSFAELAQAHSLDAVSKAKGGDLGFVPEGQIIPEIDEAVSGLEPGEFTKDPVETAFGFHIVLLEEARDRPAPAFEAVAPQLRQSLEAATERRIIDELRAAATVEKLVPDVAPPGGHDGHDH
jgi:peptidyl-prolyl cis-trans isomerase C